MAICFGSCVCLIKKGVGQPDKQLPGFQAPGREVPCSARALSLSLSLARASAGDRRGKDGGTEGRGLSDYRGGCLQIAGMNARIRL